jgi:cubilin
MLNLSINLKEIDKESLIYLLEAICGGSLDKSTSSFISPYYPENYINNLNCTWILNVNIGSRIILSFDDFITEGKNDFIEVYDGNSVSDKSIGKFSGSSKPANLISSSNSLTVYFRTDEDTVYKGFSAKYGMKLNDYS